MSTPVRFDHVLIQLSTPDFEAPPSWLTENFTILEGGTHAGNITRNNLIPLPDGTYIELLNFLTPPASHGDWTSKYPGDFALTTAPPVTATDNYKRLVGALEGKGIDTDITYTPPVPGGRINKVGEEVKWEIVRAKFPGGGEGEKGEAPPSSSSTPTSVPFFCHDVTDRNVRVPRLPSDKNRHASGAIGLKTIEVVVERERVGAWAEVYAAVLGVEGIENEEGDVEFGLRAPGAEVTGSVRLRGARTEEDERYLRERGVGVSALVFRVEGDGPQELRLPIAGYYLHGR